MIQYKILIGGLILSSFVSANELWKNNPYNWDNNKYNLNSTRIIRGLDGKPTGYAVPKLNGFNYFNFEGIRNGYSNE